MKAEGKDILQPQFSNADSARATGTETVPAQPVQALEKVEVCMTKPGVDRKITPAELQAQDKERPWVRHDSIRAGKRAELTHWSPVCRQW